MSYETERNIRITLMVLTIVVTILCVAAVGLGTAVRIGIIVPPTFQSCVAISAIVVDDSGENNAPVRCVTDVGYTTEWYLDPNPAIYPTQQAVAERTSFYCYLYVNARSTAPVASLERDTAVRAGPSMHHDVLQHISQTDELRLLGRVDVGTQYDWYLAVTADAVCGWISAYALAEQTSNVPSLAP